MKRVQPLEYDPVIHGYSVATVNKYDVLLNKGRGKDFEMDSS